MGKKRQRKPRVKLVVTEALAPGISEEERDDRFRRFVQYAMNVKKE